MTPTPKHSTGQAETQTMPIPYETRLSSDARWALGEGERFFQQGSSVHQALKAITERLNELNIPYALVGGLALFMHGFRRFTEGVDILVTRESLNKIHAEMKGLGYVAFSGSKNLRDVRNGVKIEFLVTGDYPGDGKPKDIPFPDPATCANQIADGQGLDLRTLIELKIASGLTGKLRGGDLIDAQQIIRIQELLTPE